MTRSVRRTRLPAQFASLVCPRAESADTAGLAIAARSFRNALLVTMFSMMIPDRRSS